MTEFTTDSLFDGQLHIRQPKNGYRFSMDAVVIARQTAIGTKDRVLDPGTGCGVITLILAHLHPNIAVYGVEIQKSQAAIAQANVRENGFENRVRILHRDIKDLSPQEISGPVDVMICNPPHIEKACGRLNPDPRLAVSRHEIKLSLDNLIASAQRMLTPAGRLVIIYPAQRLVDLTNRMRAYSIEPKFMRMVHTREGENARRVIIEGVKGGNPGIEIHPPLIIHRADGSYTAEAREIFTP